MIPASCEFEAEVLAAALESRWPDGVTGQLREHTSGCTICSDTALIAAAIANDRDSMRPEIVIPDSGRVWFLAQLRARREAIAAADRPITVVQSMALACATGLLGACFGATSGWLQLAFSRMTSLIAAHALLAAGTLAMLLIFPAAVYFVIAHESQSISGPHAGVK